MKAGLDELGRRVPGARLGAIGFCFGGGMVWALLDAGDERLAARSKTRSIGASKCAVIRTVVTRTPPDRAGRARQWLGAVPAAAIWAARRCLP